MEQVEVTWKEYAERKGILPEFGYNIDTVKLAYKAGWKASEKTIIEDMGYKYYDPDGVV